MITVHYYEVSGIKVGCEHIFQMGAGGGACNVQLKRFKCFYSAEL